MKRIGWNICSMLLVAAVVGCSEKSMPDNLVKLDGPYPVELEGELSIIQTTPVEGFEYIAHGWIETDDGPVPVHGYAHVLEAGDANRGGKVRARVQPDSELPDSYFIIGVIAID